MEHSWEKTSDCKEDEQLITESTNSCDDSSFIHFTCVRCLQQLDSYERQALFSKPASMDYLHSMNSRLDELLDVPSEEIPVFSAEDLSSRDSEEQPKLFTLNLKRNSLLKLRCSL